MLLHGNMWATEKVNAMNDIEFIEHAFKSRLVYSHISSSDQLSESELEEVNRFNNLHWSNIKCDMLKDCFEAINWFSPDAFCYFLPGILTAGMKEFTSNLVIYDSIISMLDRSPTPDYWDEFFIQRWTQLNHDECDAVQKWLFWFIDNSKGFDDISINRAFDTLELLKSYKK